MTIRPRATIGLALLCAFAFCAFAAPGASAEGTTAFKCAKQISAVHKFADEHCDEESAGGNTGLWEHEEIPAAKPKEFEGTNEKTSGLTNFSTFAYLTGTNGGVTFVFECLKVASTGTIENQAGPPMKVAGSKIKATYSECKVLVPVNKANEQVCQIKGGGFKTTELTSETVINGTEMATKFSPPAVKPIAEIVLESKAPNTCPSTGTFNLEGTMAGTGASNTTGGTTLKFTEQMTRATLTWAGQKAALTATETIKLKGTTEGVALTTTAT